MQTKTQIITLKSTPLNDSAKIIQAITPDIGIISIAVKKLTLKNLNFISASNALCLSDVILKKRGSEIYSLLEAFPIDENHHLRNSLILLQTSSDLIKAALKANFPQKNTFHIFYLLKSYLKKLFLNPKALYLSFLLKVLNIEGHLNIQTNCFKCSNDAEAIDGGNSFCKEHCGKNGFYFEKSDMKKIFVLCHAKTFDLIKDIDISNDLTEKIKALFENLL